MRPIQFVDLRAQYMSIKHEIDAAIEDVIAHSLFVRGPYVEKFEAQFSELMGVSHTVSCANGTDSLYIAMKALGVGPGDEVICPAHSWISTSQTITQAGGRVVFCDTHPDTYTIDPIKLSGLISENTVGIIPVHLFGQPADMDPIMDLANRRGLWVVEDCAQAHLAEYKGKKVGTMGDFGSFSFYPGKNLGAMGDAGALITADELLARKAAMFARHGGLTKGEHLIEGINSRLDGLQAAVLSVKCQHLVKWTESRRRVADYYLQAIKNPRVSLPVVADWASPVWHLFVVRTDDREALRTHLSDGGIPTVINYPVALPFLPAYGYLGHTDDDFPSAKNNQSKILSIPIYPELGQDQIDHVVDFINSF